MDLEEIENIYATDISKANDFFLKGIRDKEDKENLEKDYKEKLKNVSKKYEKNVQKFLKIKNLKVKNKRKKDKIEHFVNKEAKYERSFFQEAKLRFKINLFRFKIKLKHLEEKVWSGSLSYEYKKIKLILKHTLTKIKNKMTYRYNRVSKFSISSIEKTKAFTKSSQDKTKGILIKSIEKLKQGISRFKPKKNAPQKTSDQPTQKTPDPVNDTKEIQETKN